MEAKGIPPTILSAHICELRRAGYAVTGNHLAASLLELHADEWLPMVALHYRWNTGNADWAVSEFGRCAFPMLPSLIASRLAQPVADRMRALCRVHGAVSPALAGIESFTERCPTPTQPPETSWTVSSLWWDHSANQPLGFEATESI